MLKSDNLVDFRKLRLLFSPLHPKISCFFYFLHEICIFYLSEHLKIERDDFPYVISLSAIKENFQADFIVYTSANSNPKKIFLHKESRGIKIREYFTISFSFPQRGFSSLPADFRIQDVLAVLPTASTNVLCIFWIEAKIIDIC